MIKAKKVQTTKLNGVTIKIVTAEMRGSEMQKTIGRCAYSEREQYANKTVCAASHRVKLNRKGEKCRMQTQR